MNINGKEYTFKEVSVKIYTLQPSVIEIYYECVDAEGNRSNYVVQILDQEAEALFKDLNLSDRLTARLYQSLGVQQP